MNTSNRRPVAASLGRVGRTLAGLTVLALAAGCSNGKAKDKARALGYTLE